MRRCEARTRDGRPCQAPPLRDGDRCFHHAPDAAVERREARRKGGRAAQGVPEDPDPPEVRIREVGDLLDLLEEAAGGLLARGPSIARSRALTYLAATAARVLEAHDLDQRLARVEAVLFPPDRKPDAT